MSTLTQLKLLEKEKKKVLSASWGIINEIVSVSPLVELIRGLRNIRNRIHFKTNPLKKVPNLHYAKFMGMGFSFDYMITHIYYYKTVQDGNQNGGNRITENPLQSSCQFDLEVCEIRCLGENGLCSGDNYYCFVFITRRALTTLRYTCYIYFIFFPKYKSTFLISTITKNPFNPLS